MKWTKDEIAERVLKEFSIPWEIKEVPMDSIDRDLSRKNNARPDGAIIEEVVSDYAVAMQQSGCSFPRPVLCFSNGHRSYFDGNHRDEAFLRTGGKIIEAYCVKVEDKALIELVPRVFNRFNGARKGRAEAMEDAIFSMNSFGWTAKQAASAFKIGATSITDEIRARSVHADLMNAGVRADMITTTTKKHLSSLSNQNVRLAAARLIADCRMNTPQSEQFIRDVRKTTQSEAAQMAVIHEQSKALSAEVVTPPVLKHSKNIRTKFLVCLTSLERIIKDKKNLGQLQITNKSEHESISSRCLAISKKLQAMARN